MASAFRGWPEECQRFFIGLELDNSKKYFDAHRATYEEAVKGPMVALIESLEADYGPGKVFRANRDIRFSKDKSPYKTNIAGYAGMGGRGGYLSLDARGLTVAAGRYEMTPAQVAKYRKKVAADSTGTPLAAIVAKLEKAGSSAAKPSNVCLPGGRKTILVAGCSATRCCTSTRTSACSPGWAAPPPASRWSRSLPTPNP